MPYVAYSKMSPQDIMDLKAFMDTLPASGVASLPNEVSFPFNIRRTLGGWKFLFASNTFVVQGDLTPGNAARQVYRGKHGALRRMPHAAQRAGGA